MSKLLNSLTIGLFCLLTVFLVDVCAQTKPITNNGEKWRIGYLEGGPYANYQSILKAMTENLMDKGWIKRASIPECRDDSETRTLWDFLSTQIQSDYLEFSSDAYWNDKWDHAKRKELRASCRN